MPLKFDVFITSSLHQDNPLGFNTSGYKTLLQSHKSSETKPLEAEWPGAAGMSYDEKFEAESPEKLRLPSYFSEGRGHAANRILPGRNVVFSAAIHENLNFESVVEKVPGRFFGHKETVVQKPLPPTNILILDFTMDHVDYSTRHGMARIQLQVVEPQDPAGKAEFARMRDALRDLSREASAHASLRWDPKDILVQPTLINTREKNDPSAVRPDALAGMLEHANKVIRGTLPLDTPVTFTPDELVRRLRCDLKQAPSAAPRAEQQQGSALADNIKALDAAARNAEKVLGPDPSARPFLGNLKELQIRMQGLELHGPSQGSVNNLRCSLEKVNDTMPGGFMDPALESALRATRGHIQEAALRTQKMAIPLNVGQRPGK